MGGGGRRGHGEPPPLYLALDQGGHASRALVFGGPGEVLSQASVPVRTRRDDRGQVEHDPEELVMSLRQAIAGACGALPAGAVVAAAGLATQRSTIACWDRQSGVALAPVISWQDRRHAAWLAGLAGSAERIRNLTGLVLNPHYGASKLRWCLDNLPAVAGAAARGTLTAGPLASFLLYRLLAGAPLLADPANACRTLLWDLHTRNWSPELCRLFGIDPAVLPRAVPSRYLFGTLTTPAGPVPLTVCTGDQSAAPFAAGPLDPATGYVNVGTGAFIQRPLGNQPPPPGRLLVSVGWAENTTASYLLEGTVNGAGSALEAFAAGRLEPDGPPVPEGDLDPLLAAIDRVDPATSEPPLFLNGVAGLGSPFWVSDFPSRFIGSGDATARLQAVLESIVFLLMANLEELRQQAPPLARLLLTGGLSASSYFCRCLAALSLLTVDVSTDPEATARGLARLVAGPAAAAWTAPAVRRVEPGGDAGKLAGRYAHWQAALRASLP